MANVFEPDYDGDQERPGFTYRRAQVGRQAGGERLGASVYELPPGQATFPYHHHSANEEMLIVLAGRPALRTPEGWRDLDEGEVVAFPPGERGAHQVANRSRDVVRLLMVSEQNAPNISVYPDTGRIGIFDAAARAERRFGALFDVADAIADYGGGRAELVAPAERR